MYLSGILRYLTVMQLIVFQSILFTSCNSQNNKTQDMQNSYKEPETREPVVAGQFYPGRSDELSAELIKLISEAEEKKCKGDVLAIVSPHAGYVFSGGVADFPSWCIC